MAFSVIRKALKPATCRRFFHSSAISQGSIFKNKAVRVREKHWFEQLQDKWETREALVDHLSCNILYQDGHILALNKPNGLPMHPPTYNENVEEAPATEQLSLFSVLPDLQEKLGVKDLSEIYSQNRLFSGIVVFTKTEKAQRIMKKYFKHVRTNKVYFQHFWSVTVGIPDPLESEEEMGIEMRNIGNFNLAIKVAIPGEKRRQARKAIKPSFKHKIIKSHKMSQSSTALVEISTTSSKWDSMQLYLLHKKSPVLGDHKYSSRLTKVLNTLVLLDAKNCLPAPQVLPHDMCQMLSLKEDQTGNIPLHLHCKTLVIPDINKKGSTITLEAPVPDAFRKTVEHLFDNRGADT